MSFMGKVILITGAASGIGEATAELFAKEGAVLALVDKDGEKLQVVVDKCKQEGKEHLAITVNVANDEDAKRCVEQTIAKYGRLDVFVNSAGILRSGNILAGTLLKSYDDLINVNLRAAINLISLTAPHLIKSKGNIVQLSSVTAKRTIEPDYLAYTISKAAIDNLVKGAALELGPHGVRVNGISPGTCKTNLVTSSGISSDVSWEEYESLTALGKILEPIEVANMILYIASDKAQGVTGSDIIIDDGFRLKYGPTN